MNFMTKKLGALLLAVFLCLNLCVPVLLQTPRTRRPFSLPMTFTLICWPQVRRAGESTVVMVD